jgi:hypothetical protein
MTGEKACRVDRRKHVYLGRKNVEKIGKWKSVGGKGRERDGEEVANR